MTWYKVSTWLKCKRSIADNFLHLSTLKDEIIQIYPVVISTLSEFIYSLNKFAIENLALFGTLGACLRCSGLGLKNAYTASLCANFSSCSTTWNQGMSVFLMLQITKKVRESYPIKCVKKAILNSQLFSLIGSSKTEELFLLSQMTQSNFSTSYCMHLCIYR